MIRIERAELSKTTVSTGEIFTISITIVNQACLSKYTYAELKAYTNRRLTERGAILPTHQKLSSFKHSALSAKSYLQVETMETGV